jgi:phage shock protein PspC (stress-responsive transcriptional regulator)
MRSRSFTGLRRIPERGVVAGVCAGIAEYFDWNVKVLRVLLVLAVIFGAGTIIVVYLILWYVMDPIDAGTATASGYGGGGGGGGGGRRGPGSGGGGGGGGGRGGDRPPRREGGDR